MKKIILTVGISGSGKSTWAKQFCRENPFWLRINRDDIRKSMLSVSLKDYYEWPRNEIYNIEKLVTEQHNNLLVNALKNGWKVVIDNTHLKLSFINEYKKLLAEHFEAFEIEYKVFETPLEKCIENDKNRIDVVGQNVILNQSEKLKVLRKNLKFITEIHQRESFKAQQNELLPKIIIVDIDGTIAKMNGRFPFDWHRVSEDLPKHDIIRLVKTLKLAGNQIMFFSGRDEICKAESEAWICRYFDWNSADFQLLMRKNKDQRKDSKVKFELYNTYVKDIFYVELVIDDRQQVVDMWRRKLGLTCLQVDYGDF